MEPKAQRALMARFRSRNTKPEVSVRKALHAAGLRFRLHRRDLPGTPDIVLPRLKTVIFVHGCFWHNHEGCAVGKVPLSKPEFWREKFRRNKERDIASQKALEASGWRVVVLWECEVKPAELKDRLSTLGIIKSRT